MPLKEKDVLLQEAIRELQASKSKGPLDKRYDIKKVAGQGTYGKVSSVRGTEGPQLLISPLAALISPAQC